MKILREKEGSLEAHVDPNHLLLKGPSTFVCRCPVWTDFNPSKSDSVKIEGVRPNPRQGAESIPLFGSTNTNFL